MDAEISTYLLKLRKLNPFFATLSLCAEYQFTESAEYFETDGRCIRINPGYYRGLPPPARGGVLLHATLHAALLHPLRRAARDPLVWNLAADIVVNALIIEGKAFAPPPGTAVDSRFAGRSVEQVYEALMAPVEDSAAAANGELRLGSASNRQTLSKTVDKVIAPSDAPEPGNVPGPNTPRGTAGGMPVKASKDHGMTGSARPGGMEGCSSSCPEPGTDPTNGPSALTSAQTTLEQRRQALLARYPVTPDLKEPGASGGTAALPQSEREVERIRAHWRAALMRADTVARMGGRGIGARPTGLQREIDRVVDPQLDWRTLLWRYVARSPTDFSGFDRRFIHCGLYLDQLEGEILHVDVALDTSGSISRHLLTRFVGELYGIVRAHPAVRINLYYIDAGVDGPHAMDADDGAAIPVPVGGGGTDFRAFFRAWAARECDPHEVHRVVVYLTDGWGEFPSTLPECEVLWVVWEGGRPSEDFPFGEVALLTSDQ